MEQGYEKVISYLEDLVIRKNLEPGDRLPSEPEVAQRCGVSRSVLRETYCLLERDKQIVRKKGVGTFLAAKVPMISNPLNVLNSTGKMIHNAGFSASEEIEELIYCDSSPDWAEKLSIVPDSPVVVIKRVRKADDTAIALAWNILPENIVGHQLENGINESIFKHLEQNYSIKIVSAHTWISAMSTERSYDKQATALLGDEVVLLQQLHFDTNGHPVFYSLDYIRTDMMELTLQRERKS